MADSKISALTALAGADIATATDVLPIVDTSVTTTKKTTIDDLGTSLGATQAEVNAMTSTNTLLTPAINKIVLGTEQASTSGTSIDFTGIPAGVRRITIMFAGVSTAGGTDSVIVQLGDAGGIENSGYVSCGSVIDTAVNTASSTAGFIIRTNNASRVFSGAMVISLEDSANFSWVETHNVIDTTASTANFCGAGIKSLSAELTQLRIALSGSDTFDAGAINISYER